MLLNRDNSNTQTLIKYLLVKQITRLLNIFMNHAQRLTVWNDLPALIIALLPLPEDNFSAIMDPTMVFIPIKSIHIQADVINHPYCTISIAQVLALSPQNRFIKNISIVRNQLHLLKKPHKYTVMRNHIKLQFTTSTMFSFL